MVPLIEQRRLHLIVAACPMRHAGWMVPRK
jgi:hypothetical protein